MIAILHSPCTPHDSQPALKGWVNTFYRHYKGRKLGPYYVRRWKVGYKVFREYIKPADVEKVRAACQRYREMLELLSQPFRSNDIFIDNFGFLLRIRSLTKRRKPIPVTFGKYLRRLTLEGMRITGRPPLRRKITSQPAIVDGQMVTLRTVHDYDGTTQVFMVPNRAKKQIEPEKRNQVTFEQQFHDLYRAIFGSRRPPTIVCSEPGIH